MSLSFCSLKFSEVEIFAIPKGGFFQKVRCVFQISKSPKKIFQKTILSLKFKFPANNSKVLLVGNLDFKLRIVLCNIFVWDLEIWKTNRTFWKKPTFKYTNGAKSFQKSHWNCENLSWQIFFQTFNQWYAMKNSKMSRENVGVQKIWVRHLFKRFRPHCVIIEYS